MLTIYSPTPHPPNPQPPLENPDNIYTSSLFLFVILQEAIFGCDRRNGLLMEVLGLH